MRHVRVKCTDQHKNVAYIYWRDGWRCALANGAPAGFSYAGVHGDEMALGFALEDAASSSEVLAAVKKYGSARVTYELILKGSLL